MVTRKALITGVGGRRGIGAGIAAGLAVEGWDLALSFWSPYDDRLGLVWQPDDPDHAVNVRATWLLIAAFARQLPSRSGVVIALTSDHTVGNLPYGVTKGRPRSPCAGLCA